MGEQRPIRLLIVDDSAVIRRILSRELAKAPDIEIVATAPDPYVARDLIVELRPDVITLDLEMPRMDGLTFLGKLMEFHPMPVVVVSTLTAEGTESAISALELGAVDAVCKPESAASLTDVCRDLAERIRRASTAKLAKRAPRAPRSAPRPGISPDLSRVRHKLLAMGASTGGTEAIRAVLENLPADTPGTLIVLHMPEQFTAAYALRLDGLCAMKVREAADRDRVEPGLALVAPGGRHMAVSRTGGQYAVELRDGPQVHFQRPAVDVLFESVACCAGRDAVGVVLTGMGADGAEGLLSMRRAGARTLAQDEASSVVFGMPKEAIARGAAERVVPLNEMADRAVRALLAAR